MAAAPLLVLEHPLEERVQVVLEDYVIDLGERFRHRFGSDGDDHHRDRLLADLARTRKRLGGERHAQVARAMVAAFEQQRRDGSVEAHRAWIRQLLEDYYDPMYRYQLGRREGRRLCAGRREDLAAFAAGQLLHG